MSSTQDSKRQSLLSMIQGGSGRTESYIEDISPAQGGGAILHIFCNGTESTQIHSSREAAEHFLEIVQAGK